MEELVNEGVVGKMQGKGTIVQQKLIDYAIHAETRFTETLEKSGRKAETNVIRKVSIPAPGEVAELLQIEDNKPVALIETLRRMDDMPFSLATHYLPLEKAFDLIRTYAGGSLHLFLLEHYGIKVSHYKLPALQQGKADAHELKYRVSLPNYLMPWGWITLATEIPSDLCHGAYRITKCYRQFPIFFFS